MPFLFLGLFIIFLSVISLYRKRHDRRQNEVEENFWARESEANHVRRKDISELPYITIPFDSFSLGSFPDDALSELEISETAFHYQIYNKFQETSVQLYNRQLQAAA